MALRHKQHTSHSVYFPILILKHEPISPSMRLINILASLLVKLMSKSVFEYDLNMFVVQSVTIA